MVLAVMSGSGASDLVLPGVITAAGSLTLLGSLGWLAERGIWARRSLPEDRYRGPSIVLLFVLAVAAANVLSLPPLLADALAGGDVGEPSTFALIVLLLVTPLIFGMVGALFVIRPRALVGVRFGDGAASVWNVGRGVALGAAAWVAANAVAIALTWLVTELTGE
ncbi:MAG: hypothetical protein EHM90_04275, partial [Chloroflexi bacterium]